MSVRLTVLAAVVMIVWAAVIGLTSSVHPLNKTHFVAAAVVVVALVIQRVSTVQAWLSGPKNNRKERIEAAAQQTLINLCAGRVVSADLMDLRVHVWEVPLWYRRLFAFPLRNFLRNICGKSRNSTTWTLRPTLSRAAALGLLKQPPSGVRFQKGVGLVGVCIANNDRSEYLTLNVNSAPYKRALHAQSEAEWKGWGPQITHNLDLEDARKLSRSYGQVLAKVVQDVRSGEAIGCVTISAPPSSIGVFNFRADRAIRENLTNLAQGVAPLLVS
jgi:hypothetical protein